MRLVVGEIDQRSSLHQLRFAKRRHLDHAAQVLDCDRTGCGVLSKVLSFMQDEAKDFGMWLADYEARFQLGGVQDQGDDLACRSMSCSHLQFSTGSEPIPLQRLHDLVFIDRTASWWL